MPEKYINRAVTTDELRDLRYLAAQEEDAFFRRNPHVVESYRERLLLVTLCQGAALQYIGSGYGVKDFDVHFFYAQNPMKPRLSRAVKRVYETVGNFPEIPIDFIRTVIPNITPSSDPRKVNDTVQQFLRSPSTPNARHLAEKAVVGLSPTELYALQIWPIA